MKLSHGCCAAAVHGQRCTEGCLIVLEKFPGTARVRSGCGRCCSRRLKRTHTIEMQPVACGVAGLNVVEPDSGLSV